MHFINFNIHTDLVPQKLFELKSLNFIIYPSKKKIISTHNFKTIEPNTFTGLIIKGEKESLTPLHIKKKLQEFLQFSNFLFPSHYSLIWAAANRLFDKEIEEQIQPIVQLDSYLNENLETQIENISAIYSERVDYNQWALFPHGNFNLNVDFEKLLGKFLALEETDRLKHQISLFALNESLEQVLYSFYHNSNMTISFMYAIIDSLMNDFDNEQQVEKKCKKCGNIVLGKKTTKKRIKQFLSNIGFSGDNHKLLFKILDEHSKIRNDFFHETKIERNEDIILNKLKKKGGTQFSLEEDIKTGARTSGFMLIKEVCQIILIKKLEQT